MRRAVAIVSGVAIATVMTVGLLAQAKPNFTGKWVQDPPPAAPAGGGGGGGAAGGGGGRGGGGGGRGGGGWGPTFDATQDATTLKISRVQGQNPDPIVEVYKLDGSDSSNTGPARGNNPPVPVVSKAVWDGNKIVITSSRTMNAGGSEVKIDTKRTLSMDNGMLVIESSSTNPQGGDPIVTKVTYKKG